MVAHVLEVPAGAGVGAGPAPSTPGGAPGARALPSTRSIVHSTGTFGEARGTRRRSAPRRGAQSSRAAGTRPRRNSAETPALTWKGARRRSRRVGHVHHVRAPRLCHARESVGEERASPRLVAEARASRPAVRSRCRRRAPRATGSSLGGRGVARPSACARVERWVAGRVVHVRELEVLPHQDAARVAPVVEGVGLVDHGAADAQHVHARVAGGVERPRRRLPAARRSVTTCRAGSSTRPAEDAHAVDHEHEAAVPRVDREGAEGDVADIDADHLAADLELHPERRARLRPVRVRPPEGRGGARVPRRRRGCAPPRSIASDARSPKARPPPRRLRRRAP